METQIHQLANRVAVLEQEGFIKKESDIVEQEVTLAFVEYLKSKFPEAKVSRPENFQKKLYSWANIDEEIGEMDGIVEFENDSERVLYIIEAKHDTTIKKVNKKINQLKKFREYFDIVKKIVENNRFLEYLTSERDKKSCISDKAKCQKEFERKNSNVERVFDKINQFDQLIKIENTKQANIDDEISNLFKQNQIIIDSRFITSCVDRTIKGHNLVFDRVEMLMGGPHWTDEKRLAFVEYLQSKFPEAKISSPESFQKKLYSWANIDEEIGEIDGVVEFENDSERVLYIIEAKHDTTIKKVNKKINQLKKFREYFKIIRDISIFPDFQQFVVIERNIRSYTSDRAKCQQDFNRKNSNIDRITARIKEIQLLLEREESAQFLLKNKIQTDFNEKQIVLDTRFITSYVDRIIKGHNLIFDRVDMLI